MMTHWNKNECDCPEIISGTDFTQLFTIIGDEVELPPELPAQIPDQWLEDLDDYDLTAQLSSSQMGTRIVVSTDPSVSSLPIVRISKGRYAAVVTAERSSRLEEGNYRITLELRHKETGVVQKAESPFVTVKKVRNIIPEV